MLCERASPSVDEILDEGTEERAAVWIVKELNARSKVGQEVGALVVVEHHCIPYHHRDLEDLAIHRRWRTSGGQEHRLDEREEDSGDFGLLHHPI